MSKSKGEAKKVSIMFTCIGRRVSLLKSFRKAAGKIKVQSCIIGTDSSVFSSALELCDRKYVVHPVKHRGYLKQILEIVKSNKVDLLIPTVDLDLKLLADSKERFEKLGCCVLISQPGVIEIAQDKRKTYRFLAKHGFNTPDTVPLKKALAKPRISFPCFLKPWDGHASRGNATVHNRAELKVIGGRIPNCIVQDFIEGEEYTCDVFVDFDMKVRCVVPRKRIEVRSGEVSKGKVVKDSEIMRQSAKVVESLGAGPGVITIQLIKDKKGGLNFIEINPRFGGGVPLSIKAGADFPKWILQEFAGKKPKIAFDGFKDGLVMLRYDAEVWV